MANHRDAMRSDARHGFEKSQGGHDIADLLRCQQDELQMLARLCSPLLFLVAQNIPHEGRLVRRAPVAAAKRVEESIRVLEKERRQDFSRFRNLHSRGMVRILATRAVNEEHYRKGTRPSRLPKVTFQVKLPAWKLDDLRNDWGCVLAHGAACAQHQTSEDKTQPHPR